MINVKTQYETLHNACLKERIIVENMSTERLETVLIKIKHKNEKLYLAAE